MCVTRSSSSDALTVTYKSIVLSCENGIGVMSQLIPNTNKTLKILDHTILPIAISDFPLSPATMDVTSSGSDVPIATTVSPIILSGMP